MHRSLLSCYETTQPAGCWECREEGLLVGTMARDGAALGEIRAAIDKRR
jgi:hypothetical protein